MTGHVDALVVEFCGEEHPVESGQIFFIGRDADLDVDDNPYLHRRFLQLSQRESLWWLSNIGSQLTATIADESGSVQAWLAPGASIPLVFDRTEVWFSAGPTTYELTIQNSSALFVPSEIDASPPGQTTIGRTSFTPDQRLLVVALCEPFLRGARGSVAVPSSAEAAARLGWTLTKFNRKLDNVCQKLSQRGVRGLHGGPEKLATSRRARLVEYALATRLVDRTDLMLIEPADADADGSNESGGAP